MSGAVDTKTVEMRFDNQDFEKNCKQSMSTLEKLKKALKLDGASRGLSDIEKASKKLDFRDLQGNVDSVGKRFSALEAIATGVFFRIGQKAADAGLRMVKSMTVDQLSSAWGKYEEKTTSVQTIMANLQDKTGRFIDEASKMAYVNEQIEKLNWFSDETSYSLTDMTSNIGKFVANGQDLEESVTAMQGIATWAAISGQNSQTAARAMYNISQAMGVGAMKVADWKSIELANMATAEFKETAIAIAQEKGKIKAGEVTVENFRETLQKGWFDKDVMMDTFKEYGSAVDLIKNKIDEVAENTGLEIPASKALEMLSKDEKIAQSLGFRAFKAAQEAKTFHEALSATADAVSTKWMQIFELIFGNYLEQRKLWTDMANDLWDVFAAPLDGLKEIFKVWNEGFGNESGRKHVIEGFRNFFDTIIHSVRDENGEIEKYSIFDTIKNGFKEVFGLNKDAKELGKSLWNLTKRFRDFSEKLKPSEKTLAKIQNAFEGLFTLFKIGGKFISAVVRPFKDLFVKIFPKGVGGLLDLADGFGTLIKNFSDFLDEVGVFDAISDGINWAFGKIGEGVDWLSKKLTGLSFTDLLKKVKFNLSAFFDNTDFKTAFQNIGSFFSNIVDQIKIVKTDDLPEKLTPLQNFFLGIKNIFLGFKSFFSFISPAFKFIGEKINNFFTSIATAFENRKISQAPSRFQPIFDGIKSIFSGIGDFFASIGPTLKRVGEWIGGFLGKLGEGIAKFAENKTASEIVSDILKGGFFIALTNFINSLAGLNRGGKGILKSISGDLDAVKGVLKAYQREINVSTLLELAMAIGVLAGSMWILSRIPADRLQSVGKALLQLAIVIASFSALKEVVKSLTKANAVLEGKDPDSLFGKIKSIFTGVVQTSIFANDASAKFLKVTAGIMFAAIAAKKIAEAVGIFGEAIIKIGKEQDDSAIKKGGRIVAQIVTIFGVFALLSGFTNRTGSALAAALAAYIVVKAIAKLVELIAQIGSDAKKIENIKKFLDAFSDTFKAFGNFILKFIAIIAIAEILMAVVSASALTPGLANVIKQFGKNFERIALALVIVAGAMYLYSQITFKEGDIDNIAKIFGGFIALVGVLQILMALVSALKVGRIAGNPLSTILKQFGNNFLKIAASLLIVALAVKLCAGIEFKEGDVDKVKTIFGGFLILAGIIALVAIGLSAIKTASQAKIIASIASIAGLLFAAAASLLIVTLAVKLFKDLKLSDDDVKAVEKVFGGFLGIVGVVGVLAGALTRTWSGFAGILAVAASYIAAAYSLQLIADAFSEMSKIDPNSLEICKQIMTVFIGLVGVIGVAAGKFTSGVSGVLGIIAVGASYVLAALAIKVIADALVELSGINSEDLFIAGVVIAGIIAVLSISIGLMGFEGGKIAVAAASLLIASAAVFVLALSIASLADIDQNALINAAVTLTLMMAAISLIAVLVGATGAVGAIGGAAMLLAAAAVLALAAALSLLADVDLSVVSSGLIDIGIALVPLAVGCAAAGAGILVLAAALVVFAAGAVVGGAGALVLAAGILAVALAIGVLAAAVTLLAVGIALLIGDFEGVSEVAAKVKAKFNEVKAAIAQWASELVGRVKEKVSEFISQGKDIIANIVSGIKSKIDEARAKGQEIMEKVKAGVESIIGDLKGKGEEIITKFKDGITSALSSLLSVGKDMINKVKEGVDGVIDKAKNWGADLVSNFCSGIKSMIGSVKNAAGSVANAVRSFLHFSEPDVGPLSDFHTYAPDMIKLWCSGVYGNLDKVEDSSSAMANTVYDGFSTALEYVSDLIDNGMSDELSIRPVMDLSEIQNGMRNLDSMIGRANGYSVSGTAKLAATTAYGFAPKTSVDSAPVEANANGPVNNYNTFNITNDDPEAVAQKVSKLIGQETKRAQAVWAR